MYFSTAGRFSFSGVIYGIKWKAMQNILSFCVRPELELLVHKGANLPQGPHNLTSKHAQMNIQFETAAGDPSYYPGNDHAYN